MKSIATSGARGVGGFCPPLLSPHRIPPEASGACHKRGGPP
ncbi:hypothetical protein [Rubricoccus marinus]|nr:hypothetical protein [Rubricoccus marinus]